jgi:DNA-directed RNA polymerase subunit RPC12/RpoP
MSEFKFSCPHCEQHLQCDEQLSGRQIQCPKCNHLIKVPPVPGHTADYTPQSGLTWNTFIPGAVEPPQDLSIEKAIPKPPHEHSQ